MSKLKITCGKLYVSKEEICIYGIEHENIIGLLKKNDVFIILDLINYNPFDNDLDSFLELALGKRVRLKVLTPDGLIGNTYFMHRVADYIKLVK